MNSKGIWDEKTKFMRFFIKKKFPEKMEGALAPSQPPINSTNFFFRDLVIVTPTSRVVHSGEGGGG